MRVEDFDFHLPEDLIALEPAARRDQSRLLHVQSDGLGHYQFADLPTLLRPGDCLVVNETRVIAAALSGTRPSREEGGAPVSIDLNLLSCDQSTSHPVTWSAMARPAKRLREGDKIHFKDGATARVVKRAGADVTLHFAMAPAEFDAWLEGAGAMPLPPYIARKRKAAGGDKERYQTVFASTPGSVAAPTAGLHFTDDVFAALNARDITVEKTLLHVGAGTFLPVTAERVEDHRMHAEWGVVTEGTAARIAQAKSEGRRIVSVGTTTTRLLEAASLKGELEPFEGWTDIFITPGFTFRTIDAMITNFHLPKSTLLMLISALSGYDRVMAAYREAIAQGYRFFSYGDACLLEKDPS